MPAKVFEHFEMPPDATGMVKVKCKHCTSVISGRANTTSNLITHMKTLCLRHGYAGSIGGATPGKKIMQLRVISYNNITDLRNGHILVTGERDPGFFKALVRSVIKNFSLAFFFPACFTVFFFRYNRAAYDVLAQTIVVEVERQPN